MKAMTMDEKERGFSVKALGEIAIRCGDLRGMSKFYQDIIGLEHLSGNDKEGIIFFKIAPGYDGHTSVLALFRPDAGRPELHPITEEQPITGARSSQHHLALSLSYSEQEAVIRWYKQKNIAYSVQVFAWIGWSGIFTKDPEGNTVELVSYDRDLLETVGENTVRQIQ